MPEFNETNPNQIEFSIHGTNLALFVEATEDEPWLGFKVEKNNFVVTGTYNKNSGEIILQQGEDREEMTIKINKILRIDITEAPGFYDDLVLKIKAELKKLN